MPYYHVPGSLTPNAAAYHTNAQVNAVGTNKRGKICEINLGTAANPNPTDTYIEWDVSRITATGAGAYTSWTPTPLDVADGIAVNVAGTNASAEATTITANSTIKHWGMNQRNSLRWVAQQESQMLVWAATSGTGIILRSQSSTFTACTIGTVDFME
jgi:hypothetical protein